MGVVPEVTDSGFKIRSADGTVWEWWQGNPALESGNRILPMPIPPIKQGPNIYIDSETIALLTGLHMDVDRTSQRIQFSTPNLGSDAPGEREITLDGWHTFTMAKTRPKAVSSGDQQTSRRLPMSVPASHDRLDISLGIGYVQDLDWGIHLGASGKIWSGDTNMTALITHGDNGARLHNSHLRWLDRESGRGIEAGDLYSESWGLVRGVRYTWSANGRWPYIGAYAKTNATSNPEALVVYRDKVRLGPNLVVQGEMGTDESIYTSLSWGKDPFQVFAFRRHLPSDLGCAEGAYATWLLTPEVSLFYGYTSSVSADGAEGSFKTIGIRVPFVGKSSLAIEKTEHTQNGASSKSKSIGLTMPVANTANLYIRYQENEIAFASAKVLGLESTGNNLMTCLSIFASPRVHLDYQISRFSQDGRASEQQQLITSYRLSDHTSLQTISGFPNIADRNLLRLRLEHQFGDGICLLLDYGRLSPYQSAADVRGKRGFMVMLRRTWPTWVPARGGEVSGIVLDQLGQPLEGIAVRLANYTTLTDAKGHYSFRCVPSGRYPLSIASESIPADYKVDSSTVDLDIARDSRITHDFSIVPLGCILGRVYLDRNENGKYDVGEGISGIAVCANEIVTSSRKDGSFAFNNLEPGRYGLRIAAEALPARYVVVDDSTISVDLKPRESITGIEFALANRDKRVIIAPVEWRTEEQ